MTPLHRPARPIDPSEQDALLRASATDLPTSPDERERMWDDVLARLAPQPAPLPRRRRRAARVATAACLAAVIVTGIAVAAVPNLASRILGSDEPALDRMEVFEAPHDEEIPAPALRQLRMLTAPVPGVPQGQQAGEMVDGTSVRLLLDDEMAGVRVVMWGTPTVTERACFVTIAGPAGKPVPEHGGTGTCAEFRDGWPLSDGFGTMHGGRWGTAGAAADGVLKVQVLLPDGSRQHALMGRNAFAWVEGADGQLPVAIEAVLTDGTVIRKEGDIDGERRRFLACSAAPRGQRTAACRAATPDGPAPRPPYVVTRGS